MAEHFPQEFRDSLTYAFGHMIGSFATDAHSGDSGDLAVDTLVEIGLSAEAREIVRILAEEVHGNYTYTGEADKYEADIVAGRV